MKTNKHQIIQSYFVSCVLTFLIMDNLPIGNEIPKSMQEVLNKNPDPVEKVIKRYNIKYPFWTGWRALNRCRKVKSIEKIALRRYNNSGVKNAQAEKELSELRELARSHAQCWNYSISHYLRTRYN